MNILENILLYFIDVGILLAFLSGVLELLRKPRISNYKAIVLLAFFHSTIQYRFSLLAHQEYEQLQNSFYFFLTNLVVMGPLWHQIIKRFQSDALKKRLFSYRHYTPLVFTIIYDLILILFPEKMDLERQFKDAMIDRRMNYFSIIILLGCIYVGIYYFISLTNIFKTKKEYGIQILRIHYILLLGPMLASFLFGVSFVFKLHILLLVSITLYTLCFIILMISHVRYPNFLEASKLLIQEKLYEKLVRGTDDIQTICTRLEELMEKECLYRDDTLRLHHVAEKLLISPEKMSLILNNHYGKNFNNFVNQYRIQEACTLLIEKPEDNILDIAFEVGFNTKATFNSQFQKIMSTTPARYRKKRL